MARQKVSETLAQSMLEKIKSGEWPPHMKLKTEKALAEEFWVSRNTVREAIQILSDSGHVRRDFSAGTFVMPSQMKYSMQNMLSITELIEMNGYVCERVGIAIDIIKPSKRIQEKLGVQDLEPVYKITRTHTGDGTPVVHENLYSAIKNLEGITQEMLEQFSMTEIRKKLGQNVKYADCVIKAILPYKEIAAALKVRQSEPLLLMESVICDANGQTLSYVEDYFTDWFQFLLRRVKSTL